MIVKTRYRKIAWEEFLAHLDATGQAIVLGDPETWFSPQERQEEIAIETPPITKAQCGATATCQGPFYRIVGFPGATVCNHVAEIGD